MIDDGGPAFPMQASELAGSCYAAPGMSLRDYFAIHATNDDLIAFFNFGDHVLHTRDRCAARYAYADAMLVERVKP